MSLSMKVHVHWVDLMKNQIIQKFQSLEIWKERATNQRIHFLTIWQNNVFNGFKLYVQVTCVGNNPARKHVWLSLETHFGFSRIFYIYGYKPKY